MPGLEERKQIFRIHLQKRGRDPENFDLDRLAVRSEGFSGAEIEQSIITAMFNVFVDDAGTVDIATDNIEAALREIIPLSTTSKEQIDAMRAWAQTRARSASIKHSNWPV